MVSTIRRATVNDISAIQQVAKITWSHTYQEIIPFTIQEAFLLENYSEQQMKNRLARSLLLVAEMNKEIVGFANFFFIRENDEEAQLGAIYILPTQQSIGTGSKLLLAGIEELGGVKRIYVDVEKENLVGQRFYDAKGFVPVKEFTEDLQGHTMTLKRMVLRV